jgi:type II secretory pathway pseudopilin PulG
MMKRLPPSKLRLSRAFTMIEIAISLAIIGFALVAIIGILPAGMSAQKENRQETIINQDATIWIDTIRSGARGADDLTNYVMAITNYVSTLRPDKTLMGAPQIYWFTRTSSGINTTPSSPGFPINNGYRIIGVLSTPKMLPAWSGGRLAGFTSNYVVAYVRSISGPASEKVPQRDPIVRDLGLSYRMVSEVTSAPYDTNWVNAAVYPTNSQQYSNTVYYSNVVMNLQTNLHDLRLIFRWPVLPNGEARPGWQVYRTMVSGPITNEPGPGLGYYFFQPRTYLQVKAP